MTDTIADMLTRIRNALIAKHDSVEIPASTMKKAIAQILVDEGYIKSFEVIADGEKKTIRIQLKYGANKQRVIVGIKRISRPGLRVYARKDEMPKVLGGLGIAIGSAVSIAADDRVDSRVMFSIGVAAVRLEMLPGAKIVYGIPLSAKKKNPFFDRVWPKK